MSEQERAARRERLTALRKSGVDPYPARVGSRTPVAAVRARFDDLDTEALEANPEQVAVVGRMEFHRCTGSLEFFPEAGPYPAEIIVPRREYALPMCRCDEGCEAGDSEHQQ